MPQPIGDALRALARWAVAASLGASAACADSRSNSNMSQSVPAARQSARVDMVDSSYEPQPPSDASATAMTQPDDEDTGPPVAMDAAVSPRLDSGPAPMDASTTASWVPIPCVNFQPKVFANPVTLTRMVDYFGLYRMRPNRYVGPGPAPADVYTQDTTGTSCATSSDAAACDARLKALLVPSAACMTPQGPCTSFAVTTLGDEVRRIDDRAELIELIKPIDSPEKAVIAAFWEGLLLACRDDRFGTQIKHMGDYYVQTKWDACPGLYERTIQVSEAGAIVSNDVVDLGPTNCVTGRRPQGLQPLAPVLADAPLARHFAELPQLEAASICAFERIARELREFGAPERLAIAADAAARDEVRHAQVMAELARSFGAEPGIPKIESQTLRARFAFSLDNAVEGCVRETFGALLAHCQAALARDPAVATALARIAEDETRHAELSWEIAARTTVRSSIVIAARTSRAA
jgi:hypothetical protein